MKNTSDTIASIHIWDARHQPGADRRIHKPINVFAEPHRVGEQEWFAPEFDIGDRDFTAPTPDGAVAKAREWLADNPAKPHEARELWLCQRLAL